MSTQLTELSISLPPMLADYLMIQSSARYFSLYYSEPFSCWSDGANKGITSYAIYNTFVTHMAVEIELWNYNLGSNEFEATHHLLCDRQEQKVYIGSACYVQQFLHAQRQLNTQTDFFQFREQTNETEIQKLVLSGEWQVRVGQVHLYEILTSQQLANWLQYSVNSELIARYSTHARQGDYRAIFHLQKCLKGTGG